jgi:hypothetical protein
MIRPAAFIATALVATQMGGTASAQSKPEGQTTSFPEARLQALVGQSARLCGTVVDYSCRVTRDSVIHLWSRPPDVGITVRVPLSSRSRFGLAFEGRTFRRQVCASGPITRDGKRFIVQVDDPGNFTFESGEEPQGTPPGVVMACDQNVTIPRLLKEVKPSYTTAALSARIEGGGDGHHRGSRRQTGFDPRPAVARPGPRPERDQGP